MIDEAARWVDRLAGVIVGMVLGLAWSLVITSRLIRLGATMGVKVAQAQRLSVHTSRQYQNVMKRLGRIERHLHLPEGWDLEDGGG